MRREVKDPEALRERDVNRPYMDHSELFYDEHGLPLAAEWKAIAPTP
jgi:hypothetical protein